MKRVDRIGEINYNKYGSKMTIVEYNNYNDIVVEFDNGQQTHTSYNHFRTKSVINSYEKTILGVGFIGEGIYRCYEKGFKNKKTKMYSYWMNMLKRCYYKPELEKFPTYKDCTVCEEWHNFQVFAKWFDENYYEIENEVMCLDKDILHKNNKIYSSDNCIFIPNRINSLILKRQNKRGALPLGVIYDKQRNKYIAQCSLGDNNINLGRFETPNKAFNKYLEYKERLIKEVANEYKDNIPKQLYDALCNWKIEITD